MIMGEYTHKDKARYEEEIRKLKSEVEQWKVYAQRYKEWLIKHKDQLSTFEASMSEPNKPGYHIANND